MSDPDFKARMSVAYQEYAHTMREMQFDIATGAMSLGSHHDNKVAVDAIKWQAAKLNRVDYGEQLNVSVDSTAYTIVTTDSVMSMLSAPPLALDDEFSDAQIVDAKVTEKVRRDDE
ncbi:hypothetical protein WSK_3127 [Novosphingobium sp. Rr 2-17]|nr:hypothetical protein WSK_3127 [Novosphingobium sp. Rr 2-17]